jgi:AcrR family transcriptional regulator
LEAAEMMKKIAMKQKLEPHEPRQERAREKVELILEATMRLLERDGLAALTTNAVAAKAGVSIGTLYQYFASKDAILDELARREVAGFSEQIMAAVEDPSPMSPEERTRRIVRAVLKSYGGRKGVHRIVMEYSLSRGSRRVAVLTDRFTGLIASENRREEGRMFLSAAQAFVITHAMTGVLRAMVAGHGEDAPPTDKIEDALAMLFTSYVAACSEAE